MILGWRYPGSAIYQVYHSVLCYIKVGENYLVSDALIANTIRTEGMSEQDHSQIVANATIPAAPNIADATVSLSTTNWRFISLNGEVTVNGRSVLSRGHHLAVFPS